MRNAFSLMELLIVIVVMGILGGLGYQQMNDITEDSKAATIVDFLKKSEVAVAKTVATTGSIRPDPTESDGSYGDEETLRCFNFTHFSGEAGAAPVPPVAGDPYDIFESAVGGSAGTRDEYAVEFETVLYEEMIKIGFKNKKKGGLYLPGLPRTQILLCSRNGRRFISVLNVKGTLASRVLKEVNKGQRPSVLDGLSTDRKMSIWTNKSPYMYGIDYVDQETTTTN
jgi:prepilin-type N-terminal cleavage/methylation domain-containing protein